MESLFTRSLPPETAARVLDVLLLEGAKTLQRVGVALFKVTEQGLLQSCKGLQVAQVRCYGMGGLGGLVGGGGREVECPSAGVVLQSCKGLLAAEEWGGVEGWEGGMSGHWEGWAGKVSVVEGCQTGVPVASGVRGRAPAARTGARDAARRSWRAAGGVLGAALGVFFQSLFSSVQPAACPCGLAMCCRTPPHPTAPTPPHPLPPSWCSRCCAGASRAPTTATPCSSRPSPPFRAA